MSWYDGLGWQLIRSKYGVLSVVTMWVLWAVVDFDKTNDDSYDEELRPKFFGFDRSTSKVRWFLDASCASQKKVYPGNAWNDEYENVGFFTALKAATVPGWNGEWFNCLKELAKAPPRLFVNLWLSLCQALGYAAMRIAGLFSYGYYKVVPLPSPNGRLGDERMTENDLKAATKNAIVARVASFANIALFSGLAYWIWDYLFPAPTNTVADMFLPEATATSTKQGVVQSLAAIGAATILASIGYGTYRVITDDSVDADGNEPVTRTVRRFVTRAEKKSWFMRHWLILSIVLVTLCILGGLAYCLRDKLACCKSSGSNRKDSLVKPDIENGLLRGRRNGRRQR